MSAAASSLKLRSLVLEEWPGLDAQALEGALGDRDSLVELVAEHSGRTRTLARRQIAELESLSAEAPAEGSAASSLPSDLRNRAETALRTIEERARRLSAQVREDVVPRAEEKVKEAENKIKENLLVSLLVAMGFGLLVGLIVGGSMGRGR